MVQKKLAKNKQWGFSVLVIFNPGLSGGSEGVGVGEGGGSAAGAWGRVLLHKRVADGEETIPVDFSFGMGG